MRHSWRLGSAFGIGIYVHWTFLLLPLFVLFNNLHYGSLDLAVYAVTLVLAVFGCVVLHELGHALMARHFGIGTRDITLYPIGGVARLERMSEKPWEEFWIALAGPAVNVVIAAVLGTLLYATSAPGDNLLALAMRGNPLLDLLMVNLFLVGFNMLPAFPSDGGRVLRALLSLGLGRLRATSIAATVGMVTAGLIGIGGLVGGNPLTIFVAGFLILAGQQELAAVRYQESLRHVEPVTMVLAEPEVMGVAPRSAGMGFSGWLWDPHTRIWVLWHNGRPVRTQGTD